MGALTVDSARAAGLTAEVAQGRLRIEAPSVGVLLRYLASRGCDLVRSAYEHERIVRDQAGTFIGLAIWHPSVPDYAYFFTASV